MAEEHDAPQHRHVDRAEDVADEPAGQRDGAEPQEAERRREQQHRDPRQRQHQTPVTGQTRLTGRPNGPASTRCLGFRRNSSPFEPLKTPARCVPRTALSSSPRLPAAAAWLDELITDPSENAASIATRDGCIVREVNMTISLAFLAPDLVKAVIVRKPFCLKQIGACVLGNAKRKDVCFPKIPSGLGVAPSGRIIA
jgi:hypothetical protein